MNEITFPTQSTKTIVKACIWATLIALLVYFVVILPAEYNRDPTGLGKKFGLTVLSQPASPPATEGLKERASGYQNDKIEIVVPPGIGIEYKFFVEEGGKLSYEWNTDGAAIYSDFHGEPKGDTTGYYESYAIATISKMNGLVTVPYDGPHGWYWKNTSDKPIVVTLRTQGSYQIIGFK